MSISTLQARINTEYSVFIEKDNVIDQPLELRNGTYLHGPGSISYEGPEEAVRLRDTWNVWIKDITINSYYGVGLVCEGASITRISGVRVNTPNNVGMLLSDGAGMWVSNVHFNSSDNNEKYGMVVHEWDTLFINQTLFEQYLGGVRLGWIEGTAANVFLTDVIFDRMKPEGVGLHIEPTLEGRVDNISAKGMWSSGSHAMLFNSDGCTNGHIHSVLLGDWRATESPNGVWTNGPIGNLHYNPEMVQFYG